MDFTKYQHKLQIPKLPSVRQGVQVNVRKMTFDEIDAEIESWRRELKAFYAEKDAYMKARADYDAESADIMKKFKKDLFAELGIGGNPKKDILFQKAWDAGHSAGLSEVWSAAQDLVDLIA